MRQNTDPELHAARTTLELEGKTWDEVKGIVITIDARGETTAAEVSGLKEIIGHPSTPGTFPGDPGVPGKGMAGTLERLAKSDFARGKTHSAIAARTGGLTALVLAVVLKVAEMFLSSRGILPAAPASASAPPAMTARP